MDWKNLLSMHVLRELTGLSFRICHRRWLGPWVDIFEPHGLDVIFFLAPTTTKERAEAVVRQGKGFLYCISVAGVTGERDSLPAELPGFLNQVREVTSLPLAVGFGISSEKHVREVSEYADGSIVGSALINLIRQTPPEFVEQEVSRFIARLKQATRLSAAKV